MDSKTVRYLPPFAYFSHLCAASIIAMFVVAGVLMIATVLWEWKVTAHPIMPRRVLNRSLICSVVIDFFYYLSGYLSGTYYSSWVYIIRNDWSVSAIHPCI